LPGGGVAKGIFKKKRGRGYRSPTERFPLMGSHNHTKGGEKAKFACTGTRERKKKGGINRSGDFATIHSTPKTKHTRRPLCVLGEEKTIWAMRFKKRGGTVPPPYGRTREKGEKLKSADEGPPSSISSSGWDREESSRA